MRMFNKVLVAGAACAMVAGITATASFADPPAGTVPKHVDIVGTGSDTTQLVVDQFSTDYNAAHPNATRKLYSWDAVGSATIKEKNGCGQRTRPNGSGAGITELEANVHPTSDTKDFCVDFARSSRARASTDPNTILFLPFAIDGVTWSADKLTGTTHAVASLTTKQLNAIYSCDASLLGTGKTGPVKWNEVGGSSPGTIIPVIPQSASGTRAFFLSQIGVTTLGSCVQGQDNSVEENEGTNAIFQNTTTAPNILFPYSIAVYLAQSLHNHGAGNQGNQVLRKVNGVAPTVVNASKQTVINRSFPYLRFVYNVVRNASSTPATSQVIPTYLKPVFGPNGWICKSAAAKADKVSYGFIPATNCGVIQ